MKKLLVMLVLVGCRVPAVGPDVQVVVLDVVVAAGVPGAVTPSEAASPSTAVTMAVLASAATE